MKTGFKRTLASFSPTRLVSNNVKFIFVFSQIVAFLLVWKYTAPAVLPRPLEVIWSFISLWTEHGLSRELGKSLLLNFQAIFATTVISLALSYLTVVEVKITKNTKLAPFRPLASAISKLRFSGMAGWNLIFVFIFGNGYWLKVVLLTFSMVPFFVDAMSSVVASIPRDRFEHSRTLRQNEWKVIWNVVIRGTRDMACDILKNTAAMGWMMLSAVEMVVSSGGGIGAMLYYQNKHFHLAQIFAIQLTIISTGLLVQDYGLGLIKRLVAPYAFLNTEKR